MMMQLTYIKTTRAKAFTLIETIVAISILTMAVVGPLTVSSRSIFVSSEARRSTEATHLALEAIEIMRNIRDNVSGDDSGLPRTPWVLGENVPGSVHWKCQNGCVISLYGASNLPDTPWSLTAGNVVIVACGVGCTDRVYVRKAGNGVYYLQTGAPINNGDWEFSPYTRIVRTAQITPNMTRVTATVTYKVAAGAERSVEMVDDIYNWFPYLEP